MRTDRSDDKRSATFTTLAKQELEHSPEEQKLLDEFKKLPHKQIPDRIEIRLAQMLDVVTHILNIAEKESIEMEKKAETKAKAQKSEEPQKPKPK